MPADRRRFLQHLTLSGIAIGALPSALHASPAAPVPDPDALNELHALHELEQSAAPPFDTTWMQKLTGKYKAVFDTPEINGGSGVWRAGMWATHCRDLLNAEPADLSAAIVIRHAAMPLIMNHEFWDTYDVAKTYKVLHPLTDKKTRRNPVLMTVDEDQLPPTFASYALHKQIERGVVVLGCNLAFSSMVALVRKQDKLSGTAAREKALAMMVPGVLLQPNGIFPVTMAQHLGCSFVAAS